MRDKTIGCDRVSEEVKTQYNNYVYPPPLKNLEAAPSQFGDPSLWDFVLWPEGRPHESLSILSAGCGTNQAAILAYNNPNCNVVGIDLSTSSLEHEKGLQEKYNLQNLDLRQCNILDVSSLKKKFDLIVCTGVLHHMAEPRTGLKCLAEVLNPDGAMALMLYATARRLGLYLLQDAFKRLGLRQDPSGIETVKKVLEALPNYHYANWFLAGTSDHKHDSGIVDAFLHVQDKSYSVPDLMDLLASCDLQFNAWADNGIYFHDQYQFFTQELRESIDRLPYRDAWAIVESLALPSNRHLFMASKHPPFIPDFENEAFKRYVPLAYPRIETIRQPSSYPHVDAQVRRGRFMFKMHPAAHVFLKLSDGLKTVSEILQDQSFAEMAETERWLFARSVCRSLWRGGHMFLGPKAKC